MSDAHLLLILMTLILLLEWQYVAYQPNGGLKTRAIIVAYGIHVRTKVVIEVEGV